MSALQFNRPHRRGKPAAGADQAPLLALAAACWAGLVVLTVYQTGHAHDMSTHNTGPPSTHLVRAATAFAVCWSLMVGAMMLPLIIPLVEHARARSFRERQPRTVTLLIAGFISIWLAAGVAVQLVSALVAASGVEPTIAVLAAISSAGLWQVAPARSRMFRRCSAGVNFAPSGGKADRDCLVAGASAAVACMATCLPMMTAVMIGPMRLISMAVLAVAMLVERANAAALGYWQTVLLCLTLVALAWI